LHECAAFFLQLKNVCNNLGGMDPFPNWPDRTLSAVLGLSAGAYKDRVRQSRLTSLYIDQGLCFEKDGEPLFPVKDLEIIGRVTPVDVSLDLPDARSATLADRSLVAVDYRFYLLIHNINILLCSCRSFQQAVGLPSSDGHDDGYTISAMRHEFKTAAACNIHRLNLQNEKLQAFASILTYLSELFIVAHEVGHILLTPFQEQSTNDGGVHSLILGSDDARNKEPSAQDRFHEWVSEHLADRYASRVLDECTRRMFSNEKIARLWSWTVLCIVFHLLDLFTRCVVTGGKASKRLYLHPPAFPRLAFRGVDNELWRPACRNSGPPPFRQLCSLFDWGSAEFLLEYLDQPKGDLAWIVSVPPEAFPDLEARIMEIEKAFERRS
jgi:hypothetical protein